MSQDQRPLKSPQSRQTDVFYETCTTLNSDRSLYGSRIGSRSNSTINIVQTELVQDINSLYKYVSDYSNQQTRPSEIQQSRMQDHDSINPKEALMYIRQQYYNYFQLFTRLNIEFKEKLSIDLKLGTAEQIKIRQSEEIEKIGRGNKQLYSNNQISKLTYTQEMSTIQFQNFQLREKCKLQEEQLNDQTLILTTLSREHKQMAKQLAEAKQINAIQNNCINERKKEVTGLQQQIEYLKRELNDKSKVVEAVKVQTQMEQIQLNQQNEELKSEIINITQLMQNMSSKLYQNFGIELSDDLVENFMSLQQNLYEEVIQISTTQQNQILYCVEEIDQQNSDNQKKMEEKFKQQIKNLQATLEETTNQYENQIQQFKAQIKMLKNKTIEQEKIIDQLKENIDTMNEQLQEENQEKNNEIFTKQIKIESQGYLSQLKCKETEIENIKQELQYYKNIAENYQKQIHEEEDNRNASEQELLKQFKQKYQELQEQYQKQFELYNGRAQQEQQNVVELNQTIEQYKRQMQQDKETINGLEAREKLFNNRYVSAHEQLSVLEKQNKSSEKLAQDYQEQMLKNKIQVEKLELELTFAIKEIENCKIQQNESDNEILQLQKIIEELKQDIRNREHNIDELKKEIYNINVRKQWILSRLKKPIQNQKLINMIDALDSKYPKGIHLFNQDINASFQDEEFILFKIVYNEEQLKQIAFNKGFAEFDQIITFEKIGEIKAQKSIYESTDMATLYKGFMFKVTQSFQNYRLMGHNFVMKVPKQECDPREGCVNEILGQLFLNEFKKDRNRSTYNFLEQYAVQRKSQTNDDYFIITQIEQGEVRKLLHPLQDTQSDFTQSFSKFIYEKSKQQIVLNNLSCINNMLYDPLFSSEDGMLSQLDQGIAGINQYLTMKDVKPDRDSTYSSARSQCETAISEDRRESEFGRLTQYSSEKNQQI